jgi:hypothetical protein
MKRITFTAGTTLPQINGSYQVNYSYRVGSIPKPQTTNSRLVVPA